MRSLFSRTAFFVFVSSVFWLQPAAAGIFSVQQYSGFLYSSTLGGAVEYTDIGISQDTFSGAGLDGTFSDTLNTNNQGTATWSFTNNSGQVLEDVWFFGFLDAEVDQTLNTFFNESGALVDVSGTGAGDTAADSWEIDEPGYLFGDIYDNLFAGVLDNNNAVPSGLEDDVSMALGFNLGSLGLGDSFTALFEISETNIGGLSHADEDSGDTYYWNGSVEVSPLVISTVPEPSALLLILSAFFTLIISRRDNFLSRKF